MSVWGTFLLGVVFKHVICGFYLSSLPVTLPSEIQKLPPDPPVRGFPGVWKLPLLRLPSRDGSPFQTLLSLFLSFIFCPTPLFFPPKLDFISVSKGRVYEHVNDNELVQPVVWISPHLDTGSTQNQTRPWAPDATPPTGGQDRWRQASAVWGPTAPRLGPVQGGRPAGSHRLTSVLPPSEAIGLLFWVSDVLCYRSEVLLWSSLSVQMSF